MKGELSPTVSWSRQFYGWSQHIGELRIVVDRLFRNSGLSRLITNEILAQAVDEGLYKVMVQMTVDQRSATGMFEKVGFRHEAILKDHAKDQHGELCDLVIMSLLHPGFPDPSSGIILPARNDPIRSCTVSAYGVIRLRSLRIGWRHVRLS